MLLAFPAMAPPVLPFTDRLNDLSPSAGTTELGYLFELKSEAGLAVIRIRAGVRSLLVNGTDYDFLSGLGNQSGGTITLTAASLAGDRYVLLGLAPIERTTDLLDSGAFSASRYNEEGDLLTIIAQELRRDADRALKSDYGQAGLIIDTSAVTAGKVLMRGTGNDVVAGPTASEIAAAEANAEVALAAKNTAVDAAAASEAWAEGTLPGGAGTKSSKEWAQQAEAATVFNRAVLRGTLGGLGPYDMTVAIGSVNNLDLTIGGVPQDHNKYTISGTTFTLLAYPGALPFEAVVTAEVRALLTPADGSVGTDQLADAVVSTAKLADASVSAAKLADGSVGTEKLADESVTEDKLAATVLALLSNNASELYPAQYGAIGDGVAGDTTAMTDWVNAWIASSPKKDAILSTGTYLITSKLPNLINPKGRMIGKGRPRIYYAGVAANDIISAEGGGFNRYGQYFGNFEIQGNSLANGLFMTDKLHHSTFEDIYLRDCKTTASAMRTMFCVMNTYRNIVCSFNNDGAFTYSPAVGLSVGAGVSAAQQTIDCTFEQLKIEGVTSHGLLLTNSWYCTYTNGTSEGNGGWGVIIADYSRFNTFIGFFCEVNTSGDFSVSGHSNVFINCEGLSTVNGCVVAGNNNVFIGGRYQDFTISSGATGTILDNVEILGTYTDNGTSTVVR